jgi:hypothetical protein
MVQLCAAGIDSLLVSEWSKLQEISNLLEPFAVQTDLLQTDSLSLSSILPSILNLECHLQQHPTVKSLTTSMLRDLRTRFESILQPDSQDFNLLPAAACLLDTTLASVLLSPELNPLLKAAKVYISSLGGQSVSVVDQRAATLSPSSLDSGPPALKQFKFLATKIKNSESNGALTVSESSPDTVMGELNRYLADVLDADSNDALGFWLSRKMCYARLAPIAQDLLTAPASQAYVERIFSVCEMLTAGQCWE